MLKSSPPSRIFIFVCFAALFAAQSLYLIFTNSLTNDEPFEITGGYYYWIKGDVVTARMQPPVAAALQTFPLLFQPLVRPPRFENEDERAYRFFFESNLTHLAAMTWYPRLVNLLLSLSLGFLLFRVSRRESLPFFLTVMAIWALEPNLIAHSAIAKSDLPLSLFFFASVLAYEKAMGNKGWSKALFAGVLTGVAVTTKITALSLGLVYLGLEIFRFLQNQRKKGASVEIKETIERWGWVALGAFIWIGLIYLPGTIHLPDHRNPYSYFLDKVLIGWRISQQGWAHYFYLGQTYDFSHVLYLPMAFFFKIHLSFLILLIAVVFLVGFKKIQLKPYEWLAPLLFFVSVFPAANFGIRIMLPCFAFFLLVAGRAVHWMWEKTDKTSRKWSRLLLGVLVLYLGVSQVCHFPNELSFSNELLLREQKPFYLADADLDWGQDHLRLCRLVQQKGWTHVKLALFAGADPYFYGLDWTPWTEKDMEGPQPGWVYLVDTSFFQLAPVFFPETAPMAQGWASKMKPTGQLGDCWYYFTVGGEISKDTSPYLHSAPVYRYFWKDGTRVFY